MSTTVADAADGTTTRADAHAREVHPRWVRWSHWLNVPILAVMVWSGMRIYWAERIYAFGIGPVELFAFWPQWVYELFDLEFRLASGMAYHFTFAWLFAINGAVYLAWYVGTGRWRRLVPDRGDLADAPKVVAHDLHLRDDAPAHGTYNAAQKVTYTLVVLMGVMLVVSGVAILKSTQVQWLTGLLGGYAFARLIHFTMTIGLMVFFVVHLLQVARAGLGNLLSMVTGYVVESRRGDFAPRGRATDEEVSR